MRIDRNMLFQIAITLFILPACFCDLGPGLVDFDLLVQQSTLGDCQACKLFVESFKKGLERTSRGKYEGGDAAWEEEKLKKSYKRSEMRLIDIQEGLCKDTKKHTVQCHHMAERAEEFVEQWWAQNPDESDDIYTYICIDKLQVCCPPRHYGRECAPCLGDHSNLCSGAGKCRGDGTRKGNGTCMCFDGYTGENCEKCTVGYYESYKDNNKVLCSLCHMGCAGGCRGGSQKDCVACQSGFVFDKDEGCVDIDECTQNPDICTKNQVCLNSLGSYQCIDCDKSCVGCYGEGPDMCKKCAKGYSKKGEFCVPNREEEDQMDQQLTNTRYMTYVGLLVAAGIILPKSTSIGGLIGALVLSYIVGAEYYCMINGHEGLINLEDYDLMQIFRT